MMIVFGYAKDHKYSNDGTLLIQTRVPSIHGAYNQMEYGGKTIRNYTHDSDLPWYPSILLPHMPNEGEVVVLSSMNDKSHDFIIIGISGGFYNSVNTNIGE